MPSHAHLAARLLRDAATFFLTIGEQNPALKAQMDENANVFNQVGTMVEQDPTAVVSGSDTAGGLAARLLRDAAKFFITIGEQNEALKPQMEENATVFDQVATLIEQDPSGAIPDNDSGVA